MKNKKYVLICAALATLMLCSCRAKNKKPSNGSSSTQTSSQLAVSSSDDKQNSSENSVSSSETHSQVSSEESANSEKTSSSEKSSSEKTSSSEVAVTNLVFDDFKDALDTSKPTKIETDVEYVLESKKIRLSYYSSLKIDYTHGIALFSYTAQRLNDLDSGADELVSTDTGSYYLETTKIGTNENGVVEWAKPSNNASLMNINFAATILDAVTISGNTLSATVKSGKETMFFRNDYGVSSVSFEFGLDETKSAKYLSMDFTTSLGAKVSSSTAYSYRTVTLEV